MFTAANSFAATLCSSNSEIVAVTAGDAQCVSHTRQSCTMHCDVKRTVVQCRMAKGWRQLIPTECPLWVACSCCWCCCRWYSTSCCRSFSCRCCCCCTSWYCTSLCSLTVSVVLTVPIFCYRSTNAETDEGRVCVCVCVWDGGGCVCLCMCVLAGRWWLIVGGGGGGGGGGRGCRRVRGYLK